MPLSSVQLKEPVLPVEMQRTLAPIPYPLDLSMISLHRHHTFTWKLSDIPLVQVVRVRAAEGRYFSLFVCGYGKMNRRAGRRGSLKSLGRDDARHACRMRSSPR